MAITESKIKSIIKKLDTAREALGELYEVDARKDLGAGDGRLRLQTDLREYADYLETAKWWRK